ncbi:hypothetical protein B0H63DRAFT_395492 [Podospora didyma]|uniref:Zn(2)-C6 fungal-type domain-containing protein n=1 Tax=Podospora didyma TaxID=330526 RepID=A0AAE0TZ40_9PEZI|nr:hypothetical protein B0H63DRAFT_395492 [Podospora didyma]
MVYSGKPSRGCQMCRTRRIKCDETKPTCQQCAKSRRQCPGYKEEFDLVFRNETGATERRASKAGASAGKSSSRKKTNTAVSTASKNKNSNSSSPFEGTIIPALQVPTERQATCHFVSNFVLVPRQGSTRGYMDFLIPLLKTETPASNETSSHLQHAFNACALASLANKVGVNSGGGGKELKLPEKAYAEYTRALRATNAALRDPEASKTDGVLAAVLMLGMFENITAKQIGDLAWNTHIEGAIQIVKARGRKQLRTRVGLQLFIAVRTQVIIHCLSSGKPPPMGVDWWLRDAVSDTHAAECQRLNLQTCELRAEITHLMESATRTPDNLDKMVDLMRRAQGLDHAVTEWMASVPENWHWRTKYFPEPPGDSGSKQRRGVPREDYITTVEVFPGGRVDLYSDLWIASVWNLARTARLVLMSITVRCAAWICSPVDYRTTLEYATASRACVEVISDIIASVPYHLGWQEWEQRMGHDDLSTSEFACGQNDSIKGLAGYFLTWPLACVMAQDYTTDNQRLWVRGRLKRIGDELGIRYAHILLQLQIRLPSMLIRRDGLVAQPYPQADNFAKMLTSARHAPPVAAGYALNPLQQREAMLKEKFEQSRDELLDKAAGGATNESVKSVAKKWLSV